MLLVSDSMTKSDCLVCPPCSQRSPCFHTYISILDHAQHGLKTCTLMGLHTTVHLHNLDHTPSFNSVISLTSLALTQGGGGCYRGSGPPTTAKILKGNMLIKFFYFKFIYSMLKIKCIKYVENTMKFFSGGGGAFLDPLRAALGFAAYLHIYPA